jgi:hypothetical protein
MVTAGEKNPVGFNEHGALVWIKDELRRDVDFSGGERKSNV